MAPPTGESHLEGRSTPGARPAPTRPGLDQPTPNNPRGNTTQPSKKDTTQCESSE